LDNRGDIVVNILLLTVFVMKRNDMRCQRVKSIKDIGLRAAGDAETKTSKIKLDKVLDEVEDTFAWRHYSGGIGTLVESIYDEINHRLFWELQHILQALDKRFVIRQPRSIIVCGIKARNDFVARI